MNIYFSYHRINGWLKKHHSVPFLPQSPYSCGSILHRSPVWLPTFMNKQDSRVAAWHPLAVTHTKDNEGFIVIMNVHDSPWLCVPSEPPPSTLLPQKITFIRLHCQQRESAHIDSSAECKDHKSERRNSSRYQQYQQGSTWNSLVIYRGRRMVFWSCTPAEKGKVKWRNSNFRIS